ncbi:DNA alkylation repair protein [Heliobacillus mobilis]|uniref:DNA alkylation repair protein n=1 Tax=Heliobacterium mobile TaxID=28064 RepID=A0A6I3SJV8_HELMO|nr:DNA alkylation repair protein [Heliobacterium mobile]MTV49170.1 DNA alkylation repair protein [Heliobacterium mobile]
MSFYVQELVALYSLHSDAGYAEWSKQYMRSQFDFLGIRSPVRKRLIKQFIKSHGLPVKEELKAIIETLWRRPEREYQYAAIEIVMFAKKNLSPEDMPWLVPLLMTKQWWDTIDLLSPQIMGYMFTAYPQLIPDYPDRWIDNADFWLQRSAILYQLNYKEKTDESRLFRYILQCAGSNEFFVQKAIGWALRQYARTSPEKVQAFVSTHPLKPLCQREALKHIGHLRSD